jgi:hypothetical protein
MSVRSLEAQLQALTAHRDCAGCCSLWSNYQAMKQYLTDHYYPWVQASYPWYTDHGEKHVTSVLSTCDLLLPHLLHGKDSLTCLSIYLMLCAIIWHDTGMVATRSGHAAEAAKHIEKVRELCFPDPSISRLVSQIARAHSGDDVWRGLRPQENLTPPCAKHSQTVHPQAIAAILRYADEISENHTRVTPAMLDQVPPDSRIFWDYALTVKACKPEPERHRAVINMELQVDDAVRRYGCPDRCKEYADDKGQITLIEYVVYRLQRMNRERLYCFPYLNTYVQMSAIEVRLQLCHDIDCREYTFELQDGGLRRSGYPIAGIFNDFFAEFPDLQPAQLLAEATNA